MPQPIKIGRKTRMSYSKIKEVAPMPNLIDIQTASYDWFMREGLKEVFEDISPIKDYADNLVLEFIDYSISDAPKYDQQECKDRDVTYAAPLKVRVRLVNKETGEVKEQEVFMGDFPIMTEQGTFIYNGAERVIVTQLVRSPGPYYDYTLDKSGNKMFSTTIIPNRGAWLEYETDANEALSVRVDRTRKQPITAILRALSYKSVEEKMESERRKNPGMTDADLAKKIRRVGEYHTQTAGILYEGSNAEIQAVFGHDDRLEKSLSKDTTTNYEEGLKEIYKKLRPGEPATFDSAYELIEALFFDAKRYDLAKVGRYKYNKKLGLSNRIIGCTLMEDVVSPSTGEILGEKGQRINRELAFAIEDSGVEFVFVESKITEGKSVKVIGNNFVTLQDYVPFTIEGTKMPKKVFYPVLKEILESEDAADAEKLQKLIMDMRNELSPKHIIFDDIIASVSYLLNLTDGIGL
ncbi:MAG: DNA-directed RNA polymerase subunit beta, partial [Firmicutes bacterium]|nr:DNA-directed RNA polymerase subunit beta [Bacillota bacterium]